MKKVAILILFLSTFGLHAQEESARFFIETEYQLKFSVGKTSTQPFSLIRNLDVNLPYVSSYGYPVNALNVTFNYSLFKNFSAGLGFGFSFVKFEPAPLAPGTYYDKLMAPMYLRLRYTLPFKNNFFVLAEVEGGYQYSSNRWEYLEKAGDFKTKENGGVMFGASLGFGLKVKKYQPMLKVGYEFTQFNREYVYKFTDNWLPTVYQKVNFSTYYNLLKVSLAIKF
jgi:hypothetical protein